MNDYITLPEVSRQLKISYRKIMQFVRHGYLPAFNFQGEYRVDSRDLTRFIQQSKIKGE